MVLGGLAWAHQPGGSVLKISIVIPVYNDPRISKALDSVVSQRFDGQVELIVMDGGSRDATQDVVRGYVERVSVLVSEPDRGIFDALNKGIERATGDVIGLLGADDRYEDPNVLRDVAAALAAPDVDACFGDLVYVDDDDNVRRYWRTGRYARWKLHLGWMPPHFTLFARRGVYERAGLFDISLRVAADYEHMLRLFLGERIRTRYIPRVMLRMTLGGNSNRSLRNIATGNMQSFGAWRRFGAAQGLLVPVLKPAQKLLQYLHRPPGDTAG